MEGIYEIFCGGQAIGTAKVSRDGLYYRFECECMLKKREVCKISAICGEQTIVIGTPVPEGEVFRLRTRLPAKRFSGETPGFYITGNKEENAEKFIPVYPDAPFSHLKDLKNAVFRIRNGVSGVVIMK